MTNFDIGIDLGTTITKINVVGQGIVYSQPTVVAYDNKNDRLIAHGQAAYEMLGKAPKNISVVYPLSHGVISDYKLNEIMMDAVINHISHSMLVKPRVCICVHSSITGVEKRAFVDAALFAGARRVYLIDETISTALGCDIDIAKPSGVMIVNIGGGITDVAVMSFNGIVKSKSVKLAGQSIDDAIAKYILDEHHLLIGIQTAEKIKKSLANVHNPNKQFTFEVKGRNIQTGLPEKLYVDQQEIFKPIKFIVDSIINCIKNVFESTPPELVGDIKDRGIYLSGGTCLLNGMQHLIQEQIECKVNLTDNPIECSAIGSGKVFENLNELSDGFSMVTTYNY